MSRWFRFYADAMRHPKVAKLSDAQFRLWVELLSVAAENDGCIPAADDLKHILKRRLDHLLSGLDGLIRASLIDVLEVGYAPHGWRKRQYKSDTSTDRVKKHRAARNVSETPPEAETDTETEEAKASNARDAKIDVPSLMVRLCRVAGLAPPDPGRSYDRHREWLGVVEGWIEAGAAPDLIEQCVAARIATAPNAITSLRYFDGAVRDALATRPEPGSALSADTLALIRSINGEAA